MLRPKTYITIENEAGTDSIAFDFCNEWSTDESYELLTNTARIVLPRKLTRNGLNIFSGPNPLFKRGDKVKIEAGYFPNREIIFEGFISHVSTNIPVILECEDYMFVMKKFKFSYPKKEDVLKVRKVSKKGKPLKHFKTISPKITLKQLVDWIWSEGTYLDLFDDIPYPILVDDNLNLGELILTNLTPAQAFEHALRDRYSLYSYFVGRQLYIGFANNAVSTNEAEYVMERVGINSNELTYQREEDIKVRVKCVGMLPDNTRVEAEFGDVDGEQRTFHFYNVSDPVKLKEIAESRVKDLKWTGLAGNFETFGEPRLNHGDRCKIVSIKRPELNGVYLIRAVNRSFGVDSGYRQMFTLGEKIA